MVETVKEIVAAVKKKEFDEDPAKTLFYFSLTLQSVFKNSMEVKGDYSFKIQHKRKYGLTGEQKMQFSLECNENVFMNAETFYEQHK